jgi:hypothetical protein
MTALSGSGKDGRANDATGKDTPNTERPGSVEIDKAEKMEIFPKTRIRRNLCSISFSSSWKSAESASQILKLACS